MGHDAYYFKHDADAQHDPKIKALINKYKVEGYGRFWMVLEMFRNTAGYKLEDKKYVWEALAQQMQCTVPEVKTFIKDCVEEFELFIQEDGFIYSMSFLERMSKLDEKRQKAKFAAYSMHYKQGHNIDKFQKPNQEDDIRTE